MQVRLRRSVGPGGGQAAPQALRALEFALAQIGDPYLYAANGPDRWDCSGLTVGAYRSVGIGLPRVSRQQFWAGAFVPASQLLPGDLVFLAYVPSDPTTIHHVGMYAGDGLMVHAPRTGDVVRLGPVHLPDYAGAVRIVPAVSEPTPTTAPPTGAPPSTAPSTTGPPAITAPPTGAPPSSVPPTTVPPTTVPPITVPPTTAPPTSAPATTAPPTSQPPAPGEVSPAPATAPPDVTPSGAASPAPTP
jgi:hypothetical protein